MSQRIRSYRDLEAWQAAMDLVEMAYDIARRLPALEQFGLAAQTRRAAVSIAANIAEGHGRKHLKEYLPHLATARGSPMELETQFLIAQRLGYVEREALKPVWRRAQSVGRLMNGLIRSLESLDRPA